MASKKMEEEMKELQKHFGGIIKLVKGLKANVETLERKISEKENEDIKEILDSQAAIDKILVANSEAIKRIDTEIQRLVAAKDRNDVNKDVHNTDFGDGNLKKKQKKCKFYNRGFCKYKRKGCRFLHPQQICKEHLEKLKCVNKDCGDRHPSVCKWLQSRSGCKRGEECDFLHVTLASDDGIRSDRNDDFQCVGCKSSFTNINHVKIHSIENTETVFCLNCDDWILHKTRVFDQGWTLLDNNGFLRRDI